MADKNTAPFSAIHPESIQDLVAQSQTYTATLRDQSVWLTNAQW
ncbi:hypothetical protein C8N25_12116 [Algoriphagus antarcticus]|uniref:Uncharacterized protein n=1 Tax=Algoriphagus antarcticus TaxID=238540 RepID=A0A3E0DLU4_9BACT|nr:hypothetical protein C8N25_12116 [Algoriphagus antarcticus]